MDTSSMRERVRELDGVVVAVGLSMLLFGSVMVASGAVGVVGHERTHEAAGSVACQISPIGTAQAQQPDNGTVVFGSVDGKVAAVDAGNGSVKWENQVTDTDLAVLSTVVKDGTVYAVSEGDAGTSDKVLALQLSSGNVSWQQNLPNGVIGTPTVANGTVFTWAEDTAYAFDRSTGDELWNESFPSTITSRNAKWYDEKVWYGVGSELNGLNPWTGNVSVSHQTGNEVKYMNNEGSVFYFGSDSHSNAVAFDVSNGSEVWSYAVNGSVGNEPVVSDGVVYLARTDSDFQAGGKALYASNGSPVWDVETGVLWSSPIPHGDSVLAHTESGGISARYQANGSIKWQYGSPSNRLLETDRATTVGGGVGFVTGQYGSTEKTVAFDMSDGSVLWEVGIGGRNSAPTFVPSGESDSGGVRVNEGVYNVLGPSVPCEGLWVDTREYMSHNLTTDVTVYAYDDVEGWTDVTNESSVTIDKPQALSYSDGELTSTKDKSVNELVEVRAEYGRFSGTADVTVATETVNNTDILPPMQSATAMMDDDNGLVVVLATAISAGVAFFASSLAGVAAFPVIVTGAWVAGFVGTHVLLGGLLMSIFIGLNVAQVVEFSG